MKKCRGVQFRESKSLIHASQNSAELINNKASQTCIRGTKHTIVKMDLSEMVLARIHIFGSECTFLLHFYSNFDDLSEYDLKINLR